MLLMWFVLAFVGLTNWLGTPPKHREGMLQHPPSYKRETGGFGIEKVQISPPFSMKMQASRQLVDPTHTPEPGDPRNIRDKGYMVEQRWWEGFVETRNLGKFATRGAKPQPKERKRCGCSLNSTGLTAGVGRAAMAPIAQCRSTFDEAATNCSNISCPCYHQHLE